MSNIRKYANTALARERRYRRICELVRLAPDDRLLDVGCGDGASFEAFNRENEIVGLDLHPEPRIHQPNFRYMQGDAADMSRFKDDEFDGVVAIGLMEHIPVQQLETVAKEIRRVGRRYAVVIPHKWTIIEPHYKLPLWQFYPDRMKSFLVSHFSISGYPKSPDGQFRSLNYFGRNRWRALFPSSSIATHNHISWLIRDFIVFGGNSMPSGARPSSALQATGG